MDIASPRTSGTHALRLIRKIAEAGYRTFTPVTAQEVAQESGIHLKQLNEALHRLTRDGWIVRLRRGLYSLSSQVFRETPLHEFEIACVQRRLARSTGSESRRGKSQPPVAGWQVGGKPIT